MKRTKIVATIGPASEKQKTLEAMMRAGMNVCRLNMSHGTYEWHGRAIKTIRAAAKKVGEPIAILLDLQGPKVRLGELGDKKYEVAVGDRVVFTTGGGDQKKIPIAEPNFHKYVKKGAHLLIADGTIECVVEGVKGRDIYAHITLGGILQSHKGIAVEGLSGSLPLPCLTAKDKNDAAWGRTQDIDFVALSFVKRASDVIALRKLLRRPEVQIVVKIETREAVHNFEEILKVTDAVMIARGDLGLAFHPEDVPLIEKELIEKCRRAARPVIVATEMLASMERSPRPTRAETSDVANAVIDHTDATMLSSESATGTYPVEAVSMMAHIIKKTEGSRFDDLSIGAEIKHGTVEEEIGLIASILARTTGACAIVAHTGSGQIARLLARYRTEVPFFVGSDALRIVHQINLSWGVYPVVLPRAKGGDSIFTFLFAAARAHGFKKGAKVVVVGGEKTMPHAEHFVGVRTL